MPGADIALVYFGPTGVFLLIGDPAYHDNRNRDRDRWHYSRCIAHDTNRATGYRPYRHTISQPKVSGTSHPTDFCGYTGSNQLSASVFYSRWGSLITIWGQFRLYHSRNLSRRQYLFARHRCTRLFLHTRLAALAADLHPLAKVLAGTIKPRAKFLMHRIRVLHQQEETPKRESPEREESAMLSFVFDTVIEVLHTAFYLLIYYFIAASCIHLHPFHIGFAPILDITHLALVFGLIVCCVALYKSFQPLSLPQEHPWQH